MASRQSLIFQQDDDDSVTTEYSSESQYDADRFWEVEKILAEQHTRGGVMMYLVKWVGYPIRRATWEVASRFESLEILESWEQHKLAVQQGLSTQFDAALWSDEVSKFKQHKDERRKRREDKQRRREAEAREERGQAEAISALESNDPTSDSSTQLENEIIVSAPARNNRSGHSRTRTKKGVAKPFKRSRVISTSSSEEYDGELDKEPTASSLDIPLVAELFSEEQEGEQSFESRSILKPQEIVNTKGSVRGKIAPVTSLPSTVDLATKAKSSEGSNSNSRKNPKTDARSLKPISRRPSAPSSVLTNWNVDKRKKRRPLVARRTLSGDTATPQKFANLAIQNSFQKYARNEPAPDASSLTMVNPKTGEIEPSSMTKAQAQARLKAKATPAQIPDAYRRSPPRPRQRSTSPSVCQPAAIMTPGYSENPPVTQHRLPKRDITCRFWLEGFCKRPAEECSFAHYNVSPLSEPSVSVKMHEPKKWYTCYFWKNGKCFKDEKDCDYAHKDTGRDAHAPVPRKSASYVLRADPPRLPGSLNHDWSPDNLGYHPGIQTTTELLEGPIVMSPAPSISPIDTTASDQETTTKPTIQPSIGRQNGDMSSPVNGIIHVQLEGEQPWKLSAKFETSNRVALTNVTGSAPRFIVNAMLIAADVQKLVSEGSKQYPHFSGNISFDTPSDASASLLALTCKMNSCGLIASIEDSEVKIVMFPSNVHEWEFTEPDIARPSTPAKFLFQMLPRPPKSRNLNMDMSPVPPDQPVEKDIRKVAETLEVLDFDRFFWGEKKSVDRPVFLMMPPECHDELFVYSTVFRALNRKVYTSETPGTWDYFRRKYRSGIVIVHPDVPLDSVPHLHKFIITGGQGVAIFSLGINHMYAMLEDCEPKFDCYRLFPYGAVYFITDEVFLHHTEQATSFIRLYVDVHKNKPEGGELDRIAARPGVKEWLLQLAVERTVVDGHQDDRWFKLYEAMCDLCPEDQEDPRDLPNPLPTSNLISPAPDLLPYFQLLCANKKEDHELEATSYIVNWFAGWSLTQVTEFRKFIVCYAPKPKPVEMVMDEVGRMVEPPVDWDPEKWAEQYQHIGVACPEDCMKFLKKERG